MSGAAFLRIKKLKGGSIITVAARHNKREIQAEMGATGSIDPTRSHLNYTLAGPAAAGDVGQLAKDLMTAAGVVKLRKDAVMALEIVFSLAPGHAIDDRAYFTDCSTWAGAYFGGVQNILSVDIHRDEAQHHCHVLLLPLIDGRMDGGRMVGGKQKLMEMQKQFHLDVAGRYGLIKAPAKLTGASKQAAAQAVLQKLRETCDKALQSKLWATMRDVIEREPGPFLMALGIELQAPTKKLRTMAQIFTGKGKGSTKEAMSIDFAPAKKERSLCSVDFTPKPPPQPAPKALPKQNCVDDLDRPLSDIPNTNNKITTPAMPDHEVKAAVHEIEAPFVELTTRERERDLDPVLYDPSTGEYFKRPPPAPRRHKQACDAVLMALNDRQVKQGLSFSARATF